MRRPNFISDLIMKTILCDMASFSIAACAQKVLIGTGVCNGLIIGRKDVMIEWNSDPCGPYKEMLEIVIWLPEILVGTC